MCKIASSQRSNESKLSFSGGALSLSVGKDLTLLAMAIYTELHKDELEELGRAFGIEISGVTPMEAGSANSNYALDTPCGEKYLLSIVEELPHQQAEQGARFLGWLDRHGFPSSRPVKTLKGAWLTSFRDKPVTVRTWLSGEVEDDLSADMLEAVGERMVALHRIPKPDYLSGDFFYDDPAVEAASEMGKDAGFERWLQRRLETLKDSIDPTLPRGLVHGDLFADNMLFHRGTLVAFIDFEMVCEHYFVFEIGMAITGLCVQNGHLDMDKVGALVQAYQRYRELDENEIASLQACTELAAVQTSNWRYWKFCFAQPSEENSHRHLEMKAVADEIGQIPAGVFIDAILVN